MKPVEIIDDSDSEQMLDGLDRISSPSCVGLPAFTPKKEPRTVKKCKPIKTAMLAAPKKNMVRSPNMIAMKALDAEMAKLEKEMSCMLKTPKKEGAQSRWSLVLTQISENRSFSNIADSIPVSPGWKAIAEEFRLDNCLPKSPLASSVPMVNDSLPTLVSSPNSDDESKREEQKSQQTKNRFPKKETYIPPTKRSATKKAEKKVAPKKECKNAKCKQMLCRHFLRGFCERADECDFMHDVSVFKPDEQKCFIAGLPKGTTTEQLVEGLAELGYKVINKPMVHAKGFSPKVTLESVEKCQELIKIGKIIFGTKTIDVRTYSDRHRKGNGRDARSVFVGGLPKDFTSEQLVKLVKDMGFEIEEEVKVANGFCQRLVLKTVDMCKAIRVIERVEIGERQVNFREYQSTHQSKSRGAKNFKRGGPKRTNTQRTKSRFNKGRRTFGPKSPNQRVNL